MPTSNESFSIDRAALVRDCKSLVVKLGTQVLSDEKNQLDDAFLVSIAGQVAQLKQSGVHVTLVSSGATGSGLAELGLAKRPADLPTLQAVAAVGQRKLMDAWARAFAPLGLKVAQVLLTRDDLDHRQRFLNVRGAMNAMHDLGVIPIVNENDTVSTDELVRISFGDNDILAGMLCQSIRADALVLLSVVPGVLDEKKERVPGIRDIAAARKLLQPTKSALGRGGMNSKLEAARIVTGGGELLVIGHGREENILLRIIAGDDVGTWFVPARTTRRTGISRWIRTARPKGTLVVDDGAARALQSSGKSLLPAGVTQVQGTFQRGDVIDIQTALGNSIARGLSNYSHEQVEKIKGKKSGELRSILGEEAYDEVVHRDHLIVED
jgi:glutamate 5-kinase